MRNLHLATVFAVVLLGKAASAQESGSTKQEDKPVYTPPPTPAPTSVYSPKPEVGSNEEPDVPLITEAPTPVPTEAPTAA